MPSSVRAVSQLGDRGSLSRLGAGQRKDHLTCREGRRLILVLRQNREVVAVDLKPGDGGLQNHLQSRGEVIGKCAHAADVGHALCPRDERVWLARGARAAYDVWAAAVPAAGHLAQGRKKLWRPPVQEHQAVSYGLAVKPAGRTSAAHPARVRASGRSCQRLPELLRRRVLLFLPRR
jgi:hypothetical protein